MGLNKYTFRTFWRRLYAKFLESVTLLKRNDDQQAGTVVSKHVCLARWGSYSTSGEPIKGEQTSQQFRTLHIPRPELDRIGVNYISSLDRFIDQEGRTWEPESTTEIDVVLFQQWIDVHCRSIGEIVT